MNRNDINDRFLFVGYSRREVQCGKTAMGRNPMGRKGIGKLSLFSIADEILVETACDGELNALRMSLSGIKQAIENQSPSKSGQYEPQEHPVADIDFAAALESRSQDY